MKKKVLFVVNHFRYSGGVSVALLNLFLNLNSEKYDIYLLPIYTFDRDFALQVKNKITVLKGINSYFRGLDKIVDCIPGNLLYHHFIKDKFDLEVAFQFGVSTRIIALGDNKNRICWMHTYDTKMIQRKYYESYKKIITVAKIGREKLIEDGFNKEKTDYCYNVIDETKIFELSKQSNNLQHLRKFVVITVSRLNPDKACMRYLECINSIMDKIPNIEFWIVGDGTERSKMEAYIEKHGLSKVVKLLGLQKNPYKYMAKADLYFCASYREGFSTSCQEAAILGIPVISVDVDGAKELIAISKCGKVIPNNLQAMKNELCGILNNENLINEWKKTAEKSKYNFYKTNRILKVEKILDSYLGI